jgi:hypothetical protein
MMEINTELLGDRPQGLMVADDQRDFHVDLVRLPPGQDVIEAMGQLGDEEGHTRHFVGKIELPFHIVLLGNQHIEKFANLIVRNDEIIQFPLDPHEEHVAGEIDMLIEIGDIAVVFEDKFADRGDYPLVVGTMDQKDCSGRGRIGSGCVHTMESVVRSKRERGKFPEDASTLVKQ